MKERQVDIIKSIKPLLYLVIILLFITGCSPNTDKQNIDNNTGTNAGNDIIVDPIPQPREVEITLYFKHEYADYLVPEKRKVMIEDQTVEHVVVEELLKGPQNFQRRAVMPAGTELIDVTKMDDTVFVNLSSEYLADVSLLDIPGKENISKNDRQRIIDEMKRLSVYSIVNSLTYLDDVNQVQILVENTQMSYSQLGTELILGTNAILDANIPMGKLKRDKTMNLTPSKSVKYLLDELKDQPDWNVVYYFLSENMSNGNKLPKIDIFQANMQNVEGNIIEYEGTPVVDEEITPDIAFVDVKYTLRSPEKKVQQKTLIVDNQMDGIWKVRMPDFLVELLND